MIHKYLSLIKFKHTIFALPFAFVGLVIGWKQLLISNPNLQINYFILKLILVLICMITARSAAMSFNRFLDRKIDKLNPRTLKREIPAGMIKPQNALLFCLGNCLIFIITTYFINSLCFYLSFVAMAVVLFYSYTKRFTWFCHFFLGLSLSLAPLGSYLVFYPEFNIVPIIISLAVFFWVGGFDIVYALQDYEFDKNNQLFSIPVYFGKSKAYLLAILLQLISILFLGYIYFIYPSLQYYYIIAMVLFIGILGWQHFLLNKYKFRDIDKNFMSINGWLSIFFAIFFILDLLL